MVAVSFIPPLMLRIVDPRQGATSSPHTTESAHPSSFHDQAQAVRDLNSGLATLGTWKFAGLILLFKLQLVSWFPEGAPLFQKMGGRLGCMYSGWL